MNKMKPKEMEGAKLCAPASFCVNRELKVFWSKKSDAHEDIIEEFDLHVDGVREANFVRVEVVPPKEGAFETPPDQWVFKLDQENAPSWYDKDKTEKACRIALVDWAAAKLALSGQVKTIKAGVLYACGSSAVTAYNKSTVIACDKSTVREIIGGCVRFFCKFSVKISGKMSVAIDMTGDKAICHVGEDEPRVVTGGK